MLFKNTKKILNLNLRKLILLLTVVCVSALFIISLIVSYQIVKNQLLTNSLSIHSDHANKIAQVTDNHFKNIVSELKYSAEFLGENFANDNLRENEVNRLKYQSNHYNSVVISDDAGRLINFSPNVLNISKDKIQNTPGIVSSLHNQSVYISTPYYSVKNNLIIFISYPIFDQSKKYKGFIGAAIYLKEKNFISQLLNSHYDYKKSYTYVIDNDSKIIFHPDLDRIGDFVQNNTGLDYIKLHKNGKVRLTNSRGVDSLAGFSNIPTTNWIIVSQQPVEELLKQAESIIYKVSAGIFLFYLIIFYMVWKFSLYISSPLNKLANMAGSLNHPEIGNRIKEIKPWYYEVKKFKLSLLLSFRKFSQQVKKMDRHINTDPLTGLLNRRGLEVFINENINTRTKFSVLIIDIDYFKRINDTYGHHEGDVVLKHFAKSMKESFRRNDVCCRYGGEEFIVLIPHAPSQAVYESAERFRKKVAQEVIEGIGIITITIGIASWPDSSKDISEVLKIADSNLYQAKESGRNCVKY